MYTPLRTPITLSNTKPRKRSREEQPASQRRVSPRKKRACAIISTDTADIVSLPALFLSKEQWGLRTFADLVMRTYCVAFLKSRRDNTSQYGYYVPALALCAPTLYENSIVWLTDVSSRNFQRLWMTHGRPTDKYYTLHADNVGATKLMRNMLRLRVHTTIGKEGTMITMLSTKAQLVRGLQSAVDRLTMSNFPTPAWKENSCHLDCFLLSELAFYTTRRGINIIADPVDLPRAIQRLLRVLLTLGRNGERSILNQNSARDDYRAYELSRLPDVDRRVHETEHWKAEYTWHGDMLTAQVYDEKAATYIQDERMLGGSITISCTGRCTNQVSPAATPTMVYNTYVRAPTHWYAISDSTALNELSTTQQYSGGAAVAHTTLRSVVLSHLVRPVGDTQGCDDAMCGNYNSLRSYEKHPQGTHFPRSLELDRGESRTVAPTTIEFTLTFGDVKYELISIILQNDGHYRAVVRLCDDWWDYDDLASTKGLRKIGNKKAVESFLKKLRSSKKNVLYPRVWRYSRTNTPNNISSWVDTQDLTEFNALCFNGSSVNGTVLPTLRARDM